MFETPEDLTERTRKALDHFLTKLAQEVVDELATAHPLPPRKPRAAKPEPPEGNSVPVSDADE